MLGGLQSWLAGIVEEQLAELVECKFVVNDLLGGHLHLTDAALTPAGLELINQQLPGCRLASVELESLELQVPWDSLTEHPTQLAVSGVRIVAHPRTVAKPADPGPDGPPSKGLGSFVTRLINQFIDMTQLIVTDVRACFVDDAAGTGLVLAAELERLAFESTDSKFQNRFFDSGPESGELSLCSLGLCSLLFCGARKHEHKLVTLDGLQLWWSDSVDMLRHQWGTEPSRAAWLLEPLTCSAQVTFNRDQADTDTPDCRASLRLPPIQLRVARQLLMLLRTLAGHIDSLPPAPPVLPAAEGVDPEQAEQIREEMYEAVGHDPDTPWRPEDLPSGGKNVLAVEFKLAECEVVLGLDPDWQVGQPLAGLTAGMAGLELEVVLGQRLGARVELTEVFVKDTNPSAHFKQLVFKSSEQPLLHLECSGMARQALDCKMVVAPVLLVLPVVGCIQDLFDMLSPLEMQAGSGKQPDLPLVGPEEPEEADAPASNERGWADMLPQITISAEFEGLAVLFPARGTTQTYGNGLVFHCHGSLHCQCDRKAGTVDTYCRCCRGADLLATLHTIKAGKQHQKLQLQASEAVITAVGEEQPDQCVVASLGDGYQLCSSSQLASAAVHALAIEVTHRLYEGEVHLELVVVKFQVAAMLGNANLDIQLKRDSEMQFRHTQRLQSSRDLLSTYTGVEPDTIRANTTYSAFLGCAGVLSCWLTASAAAGDHKLLAEIEPFVHAVVCPGSQASFVQTTLQALKLDTEPNPDGDDILSIPAPIQAVLASTADSMALHLQQPPLTICAAAEEIRLTLVVLLEILAGLAAILEQMPILNRPLLLGGQKQLASESTPFVVELTPVPAEKGVIRPGSPLALFLLLQPIRVNLFDSFGFSASILAKVHAFDGQMDDSGRIVFESSASVSGSQSDVRGSKDATLLKETWARCNVTRESFSTEKLVYAAIDPVELTVTPPAVAFAFRALLGKGVDTTSEQQGGFVVHNCLHSEVVRITTSDPTADKDPEVEPEAGGKGDIIDLEPGQTHLAAAAQIWFSACSADWSRVEQGSAHIGCVSADSDRTDKICYEAKRTDYRMQLFIRSVVSVKSDLDVPVTLAFYHKLASSSEEPSHTAKLGADSTFFVPLEFVTSEAAFTVETEDGVVLSLPQLVMTRPTVRPESQAGNHNFAGAKLTLATTEAGPLVINDDLQKHLRTWVLEPRFHVVNKLLCPIRLEAVASDDAWNPDRSVTCNPGESQMLMFGGNDVQIALRLEGQPLSDSINLQPRDGKYRLTLPGDHEQHVVLDRCLLESQAEQLTVYSPFWVANYTPWRLRGCQSSPVSFPPNPDTYTMFATHATACRFSIEGQADAEWSEVVNVSTIGSTGCFSFKTGGDTIHVAISVHTAPAQYKGFTKVIRLHPIVRIFNYTGVSLDAMEDDGSLAGSIPTTDKSDPYGSAAPWLGDGDKTISLLTKKIDMDSGAVQGGLSQAFHASQPGSRCLRLTQNGATSSFLRCCTTREDGSSSLAVANAPTHTAPVQVLNYTRFHCCFWQHRTNLSEMLGFEESKEEVKGTVGPFSTAPFAFDEGYSCLVLALYRTAPAAGGSVEIELDVPCDKIGCCPPVTACDATVHIAVIPSDALCVMISDFSFDEQIGAAADLPKKEPLELRYSSSQEEPTESRGCAVFTCGRNSDGVEDGTGHTPARGFCGANPVASTAEEEAAPPVSSGQASALQVSSLLTVEAFAEHVGISIVSDRPEEVAYLELTETKLTLKRLATDLILGVTLGNLKLNDQRSACAFQPRFKVPICKAILPKPRPLVECSIIRSIKSPRLYKQIMLLVQELDVMVSEDFVSALLQLCHGLIDLTEGSTIAPVPNPLTPPPVEIRPRPMWCDKFTIHPIKANVSFLAASDRRKRVHHLDTVRELLQVAGLTELNELPISLLSLEIKSAFEEPKSFMWRVIFHYIGALLSQTYRVLGSSDLLGDPVGLLGSVGTGVSALFYDPFTVEMASPLELAQAIGSGAVTLVGAVFSGVLTSVEKLIKGASGLVRSVHTAAEKGLTRTPDGEAFIEEGFVADVLSPSTEAAGALTSVVLAGTEVATEAVAGTLDGVAGAIHLAASVGAKDKAPAERSRPPRSFGPNGSLIPYSQEDSAAQDVVVRAGLAHENCRRWAEQASSEEAPARLIVLTPKYLVVEMDGDEAPIAIKLQHANFASTYQGQIALTIKWMAPRTHCRMCYSTDELQENDLTVLLVNEPRTDSLLNLLLIPTN